MLEQWVRPRWGIGSVRLHLDLEDLALALVLFDGVVLPSPDGPEEEQRYADNGWDPTAQAVRGVQLDPLAHFVTWDHDLRTRWAKQMGQLKERLGPLARDIEGLGYMETTRVIAQSVWAAVDHTNQAVVHKPVPLAWCPRTEQALAKIGVDGVPVSHDEPAKPIEVFDPSYDNEVAPAVPGPDGIPPPEPPWANEPALLVTREVAIPSGEGEAMLHAAADLARDPRYVKARSLLYAGTFALAAQDVPREQIIDELASAEAEYVAKELEYCAGGLRRAVHQLLPMAAAKGPPLVGLPGVPGFAVRRALTASSPSPSGPATKQARRLPWRAVSFPSSTPRPPSKHPRRPSPPISSMPRFASEKARHTRISAVDRPMCLRCEIEPRRGRPRGGTDESVDDHPRS